MIRTRQLGAVGVLTWRGLTRRGLRGGKPQVGLGAALTRLMLFLLAGGYAVFSFGTIGRAIARLRHGRTDATTLFVTGLAVFLVGFVAGLELTGGSLRYEFRATDRGALDVPLFLSTRLTVLAMHASMLVVLMLAAFLTLAPQKLPEEWPGVSALAIGVALCSLLVAKAACVAQRAILPSPLARSALLVTVIVSMLAALVLILFPMMAGDSPEMRSSLARLVPFLRPVAKFLKAPAGTPSARIWAGLAGATAISLLSIAALERRGYDRELAAPPGARKPTKGRMTADHTERILSLGRRLVARVWLVQGMALAGSIYLSVRFLDPDSSSRARELALKAPFLVVYMGWILGIALSNAQAMRDLRARPFLASLPITPAQTLSSKTAALRLALLPALTWLLPPLVALRGDHALLWKSGVAAIGLALAVEAMAPVEFLGSGSFRIERLLIAIPLFGALMAPTPLTELPSLGALALLAFEARRAAAQHLRWLDDAGDELERETPAWRALLVFAAFAGVQALVSLALIPLSGSSEETVKQMVGVPGGLALGVGYLVGAVALVLLTLNGRKGLPGLRWVGARAWLIPAGALAGGGAALLAGLYSKWIDRFGIDSGPLGDAFHDASPQIRTLLVCAVVAAAPVAEEMFFRGWLQPAIKVELPARWKRLAFVIAAFAFASVHPGVAFPPVFLVGLVTGVLYEATGGILAGICAHAAYNAVLTLAQ